MGLNPPAPTATGLDRVAVEPDSGLVLYGDFTSPLCYLASQRLDALARRGVNIPWCALEHHTELPVTGRRRDAADSADAEECLAETRTQLRVGETLPAHPPGTVPRTQAAVSAYAEACGADVPDQIRQLLFAAYWLEGVNIGNPEVLRTLLAATFMRGDARCDPTRKFGYAVAVNREPITGVGWRLVRDWRRECRDLEWDKLPVLKSPSRVETGPGALTWLADLLDEEPAAATALDGVGDRRELAGLGWRPPTTVTPPATWTSQVGNPWARAWLMSR